MQIREFIELSQEYERMFGPTVELIVRFESEFMEGKKQDFKVNGLDYVGHGQIRIVTHKDGD